MNKTKPALVLIVDDEPGLVRALKGALESEGFRTLTAGNGQEALDIIDSEPLDLMILDIIMPKMDGFEVCRRVRQKSEIPIIMLSARQSKEDKVQCLNLGSDDYISKPFDTDELIARTKAVLRRTRVTHSHPDKPLFACGSVSIDFLKRRVTVAGNEIKLSPTEYNLLQELALDADRVLTHAELLRRVWGPEYGQEKEYLRVFIGRLRAKIELEPLNPRYIITVPGIGYKLRAAD